MSSSPQDLERLRSARARSSSVRSVLAAMSAGSLEPDRALLRSIASLASRVAFDLAVLERNLAVVDRSDVAA